MNGKALPRLKALHYQRPYRLTVNALHTLCCAPGGTRARLQQIDLEFFTLSTNDLPEEGELRAKFRRLHEHVTSKEARYPYEGRVAATLDQLHHTKLKTAAQLIWDIHTEFSVFMQGESPLPRCGNQGDGPGFGRRR